MFRLFRSGKFWLRFAVYGTLAACAAAAGQHFLLQHLLNGRLIQAEADNAVRGTGRTVRFSPDIGRRWLPRPTVVLRDVGISRPGSRADALHIKEMHIGLAWRSLWNGPQIETWVWKEAEAELSRRRDGGWSLQDLWQRHGGIPQGGRLTVENSRISLHLPEGSYRTEGFRLDAARDEAAGYVFLAGGRTRTDSGSSPLDWNSSGTAVQSGREWLLPSLHIEAGLPFKNETLTLAADADAVWRPQHHTFQADNLSLRADSRYRSFHLSARSPSVRWQNGRLSAGEANGVFTAADSDGGRWNGSLSLSRALLHAGGGSADEVSLNGSRTNAGRQTTLDLSGPLLWQKGTALQAPRLVLNTRRENLKAPPRVRFNSQTEGHFALYADGGWQLALKGLFDRHAAALEARYTAAESAQPAVLSARLEARKISLAPYWADLQAREGRLFPALFGHRHMPRIEADIRIGSLAMPGLQMDDLQTTLHADGQRIALSNFRAGLYGGRTEGGFSIANTHPPAYRLQQNAQGVQIRPLLQDLLGYHSVSGSGNAVIDLTASGNDRQSLTRSLNGSLQLNISDGAWLGVDMAGFLRSLRNNTSAAGGSERQTPFSRFSLNSEIRGGIGRHEQAELVSDAFSITSSGQTDLNTQTVSEDLLIRNNANPAAKPVPIKISGPAANLSVTLDYNRLTYGLATPAEKRRALAETLRGQWLWLGAPAPP